MLPVWSHHSPAFLIHSIIRIGDPSWRISWLQSQDHRPLLLICRISLVEQASYSSCFLSVQLFIIIHQPALLRRHTPILDHLLTILVAFSILVSKLSFSQSLSLCRSLSLPQANLLELWPAVIGGGVVLVSAAD